MRYIDILLKEDPNLLGQATKTSRWLPINEIPKPVGRTLCSNEILFDIDGSCWQDVRKLAEDLENILNSLNIPFLRHSSGRWLHYSVFFDKNITMPNEIWQDYYRDNKEISVYGIKEIARKIKVGLFLYIVSLAKQTTKAYFDLGVMHSSRHMIRLEGSKNEKSGFFKSFLIELPRQQPAIIEEKVAYPDKIEHWKDIPDNLMFFVYKRFILKPKRRAVNYPENRIEWIEQLLNTSIPNGRHRAIDLVLCPYLANIKLTERESAVSIMSEWIEKCKQLSYTSVNENYIRYHFDNCLRKGMKPLKRENVAKYFSDVPEILRIGLHIHTPNISSTTITTDGGLHGK